MQLPNVVVVQYFLILFRAENLTIGIHSLILSILYYLHSSKNRPCFSLEPRNCGDILLKETNYQRSAVQPDRIYQIYFLLPVTHISLFANIQADRKIPK